MSAPISPVLEHPPKHQKSNGENYKEEVVDRVQLNSRLVIASCVVLFVCAASVYGLHEFSVRRNADRYLKQAQTAKDAKQYGNAISAYRQYLRLKLYSDITKETKAELRDRAIDFHHLYQQGEIPLKDGPGLYILYQQILRNEPSNRRVRLASIDISMRMAQFSKDGVRTSRYREALAHIGEFLNLSQQLDDSSESSQSDKKSSRNGVSQLLFEQSVLTEMAGDCHFYLSQFAESQAQYLQAIVAAPNRAMPYAKLATVIAEEPESILRQQDVAKLSQKIPKEIRQLFAKDVIGTNSAIQTATAVHGFALRSAVPRWVAGRNAAIYFASMTGRDEQRPLSEAGVEEYLERLFDSDENNNGVLELEEALTNSEIPGTVDTDLSGTISKQEIMTFLSQGERWSRLLAALSMLQRTEVSLSNDQSIALGLVTLQKADILGSMASIAYQEQKPDPSQWAYQALKELDHLLVAENEWPEAIYKKAEIYARLSEQQKGKAEFESLEQSDLLLKSLWTEQNQKSNGTTTKRPNNSKAIPSSDLITMLEKGESIQHLESTFRQQFQVLPVNVLTMWAEVLSLKLDLGSLVDSRKIKDDIEAVTREMSKLNINEDYVRFVNARYMVSERKWHEAARTLAELQTTSPVDSSLGRRILILRSQCALNLPNPETALRLARQAFNEDPYSQAAVFLKASALDRPEHRKEHREEAIAEYSKCRNIDGVHERIAELMFDAELEKPGKYRSWNRIEGLIETLQSDDANNISLALIQARLYLEKAKTIQTSENKSEDSVAQNLNATRLLDAGMDVLNKGLDEHPDSDRLYAAKIRYISQRFDTSKSVRFAQAKLLLDNWPEQESDSKAEISTAISLSRLLPKKEAIIWLDSIDGRVSKLSLSQQQEFAGELNDAYRQLDNSEKAFEQLAKLGDIADQDSGVVAIQILDRLLFNAVENKGELSDEENALWKKTYKSLERVEQAAIESTRLLGDKRGSTTAYYGAALDYIEFIGNKNKPSGPQKSRIAEIKSSLLRAAKLRPNWAAPYRLLGFIDLSSGRSEESVRHFRRALELGDATEQVILPLASYYYQPKTSEEDASTKPRNLDEAYRIALYGIRQARPEPSDDLTQMSLRIAWALFRKGEELQDDQSRIRANEIVTELYERNPDAAVSRFLAALRFRINPFDPDALDIVQKLAYEEAPESPEAWLSLVQSTGRLGTPQDAEKIIADCQQRLPKQPPELIPTTVGACYETLLEMSPQNADEYLTKAKLNYEKVVEINFEDGKTRLARLFLRTGKLKEAEITIQELLDPKADVSKTVRTQAELFQYLLTAASGKSEDVEQALKSIRAMEAETPQEKSSLLEAELRILRTQPTDEVRPRLIQVLEEILSLERQNRQYLQQSLYLAHLYQQNGDFDKAINVYKKLRRDPKLKQKRAVIVNYAKLLISRSAKDKAGLKTAEKLLTELEESGHRMDDFTTVQVKAGLFRAQKKSEESIALLFQFARRLGQRQFSNKLSTASTANWIAENPAQTIELLRSSGELGNQQVFVNQAAQLNREGNTEQAAEILQQVARNTRISFDIRMEAVRQIAKQLEGLYENDGLEKAQDLFKLCARNGRTQRTVLSYAFFLGRQGKFQEALYECQRRAGDVPFEDVAVIASALIQRITPRDTKLANSWIKQAEAELTVADGNRIRAIRRILGELYVFQRHYAQAALQYQEVLKLFPKDLTATNNLAWLNARAGEDLPLALASIEKAIEQNGKIPELLDTKAIVLIAMKKWQEASQVLNEVPDQNAPDVLIRRAEIFLRMGRAENAKGYAKKALEAGLNRNLIDEFDQTVLDQALKQ